MDTAPPSTTPPDALRDDAASSVSEQLVCYHFEYEGRSVPLVAAVPCGPLPTFPLQRCSLAWLTAQLMAGARLSPVHHRLSGIILPAEGPIVPLVCIHKLPPNDPHSPYGLITQSVDPAHTPLPLLTALTAADPGSVVDVDYLDLLAEQHGGPLCSSSDSTDDTPASSPLSSRLVGALSTTGYFRIRLPRSSAFADIVHSTTESALSFFALPMDQKRLCRRDHEYSKFVGYSLDGARQFYQVRTCAEELPWPSTQQMRETKEEVKEGCGEGGEEEEDEGDHHVQSVRRSFSSMFLFLAALSRLVLRRLCAAPELGVAWSQVVHMLEPLPGGQEPADFLRDLERDLNAERAACTALPLRSLVWAEERRRAFEQQLDDTVIASSVYVDHYSVGTDAFRVFQYYRAPGEERPGLEQAATGLHSDMGLITISPAARVPGLTALHRDGSHWVRVERDESNDENDTGTPLYLHVLSGDTLSFLTHGRVRGLAHFVDERVGVRRISMPYFLRANPHASIRSTTVRVFLEDVVFPRRTWVALRVDKPRPPQPPTAPAEPSIAPTASSGLISPLMTASAPAEMHARTGTRRLGAGGEAGGREPFTKCRWSDY
jgi:isopenicillin N synthase-like dioxygenase